jgi:hypothetical protein
MTVRAMRLLVSEPKAEESRTSPRVSKEYSRRATTTITRSMSKPALDNASAFVKFSSLSKSVYNVFTVYLRSAAAPGERQCVMFPCISENAFISRERTFGLPILLFLKLQRSDACFDLNRQRIRLRLRVTTSLRRSFSLLSNTPSVSTSQPDVCSSKI